MVLQYGVHVQLIQVQVQNHAVGQRKVVWEFGV
jgi:hypothetical protein